MSIFNDSFNHLSLDLAAHHKVEADFEIHSCSEFALIGSSKHSSVVESVDIVRNFRKCKVAEIGRNCVSCSTGHKTKLELKLVNMGLFGQ